jgi:hypothetical protein
MPRYYFDIQDDLVLHRDADGFDFKDDASARKGAVHRLVDLLTAMEEDLGPKTKLIIVVARRAGEQGPFAAVSSRITSLPDYPTS